MAPKFALLIFALYLATEVSGSPTSPNAIIQGVRFFVENKCKKNGHEDLFPAIQQSVFDFNNCTTLSQISANTNCSHIGSRGYACYQNFVNTLEPCLDAEEKYFPNYFLSVFNESMQTICKGNTVDDYMEQVKDIAQLPCVTANNLIMQMLDKCVAELNIVDNLYQTTYVFTKLELCTKMQSWEKCALNLVKDQCENSSKLVDFFKMLFFSYLDQCRDVLAE